MLNDHLTCCTGVYFTVCVLSWLLMISKSLTASALVGPLKLQSKLAFPAPLVLTVKWVGLFSSTPEGEERRRRERELPQGDSRSNLHVLAWRKVIILFLMHLQLHLRDILSNPSSPTRAAESWSFCLDFAGIMRRIHLDPDWRHWYSLNNTSKRVTSSEGVMRKLLLSLLRHTRPTWSANSTMMV